MRVYNSFIAVLAVAFAAITGILAALGVDSLDVYFTGYALALIVQSALYLYFSPRARRALGLVSLVAAAGFMALVSLKVFDLLLRG